MSQERRSSFRFFACAAVLVAIFAVAGYFVWRGPGTQPPARLAFLNGESAGDRAADRLSADDQRRVEVFCGDCHALPRPESFARHRWHHEVRRGYEFYAKSGRTDLDPPAFQQTLAYYRARAPETVVFPRGKEAAGEPPVRFEKENIGVPGGIGVLPEIAHLRWARLAEDEDPVLLATDLRHGQVVAIDLRRQGRKPPRILARLRNPGRVEVCDLDGDGRLDLVVGDLGSYLPSEHDRGRVVLLRRRVRDGGYEVIELATGLARVADVRAADLDADGKLDLVVAEFGWRETGRLLALRNLGQQAGSLRFEIEEIDDRSGALDVRPYDFTGDGRPEILALFSQEHESLDLFENREPAFRPARYARRNLWTAPDLTFGSTGMELADLNGDGKIDIVYTNGDTFDNDYATPWHGVQWLENQGESEFVHHRLTDMPGAYRAVPGDFDRDGLLDVAAAARLPPQVQPKSLHASPLASIVLLRQTAPGVFARYTLEYGSPDYPTLEAGDFDGDGGLDFAVAVGPYAAEARQARGQSHFLTVWWSQAGGAPGSSPSE